MVSLVSLTNTVNVEHKSSDPDGCHDAGCHDNGATVDVKAYLDKSSLNDPGCPICQVIL